MRSVLIVDDSSYMRMNIKKILMTNGYRNITEAANGREALEYCKSQTFDVILMDIQMPEMDGITATKEILALKPKQKIIIISAEGEEHTVKEAVLSGASNFIIKPFKENKVVEVIECTIMEMCITQHDEE